jgi:hypothetical protein
MKPIVATVTGACLLISFAGVVQADNAHLVTGTKGQPGAFNTNPAGIGGITCNSTTSGTSGMVMIGPGPGGSVNGKGSPFNVLNMDKRYAGNPGNPTGPGGNANNGTVAHNSGHAVSEYDVACFQATQHMP